MSGMNPKKAVLTEATPKNGRVVTLRASAMLEKQIKELCAAWGENVTQVIYRAINQAYEREFKNTSGKK